MRLFLYGCLLASFAGTGCLGPQLLDEANDNAAGKSAHSASKAKEPKRVVRPEDVPQDLTEERAKGLMDRLEEEISSAESTRSQR